MRFCIYAFLLILLFGMFPVRSTYAQDIDPPKYEFRGAWIATAWDLDWPSGHRNEKGQKDRMKRLLDYLKDAGINAVFFQVRSFGDAMYESNYEPWSHLLTGVQGRAPSYDPLSFTVEEAHLRGMEVHAWVNPYRVHATNASWDVANNHIIKTHPEWTYRSGSNAYLDPGRQAVRDYVSMIVMDLARRYDVDGVHFDDYFYPYPPNHFTLSNSPDRETFEREGRGFTDINEWRRDNVNLLVAQIADSLRTYDSSLKFGISPFGIWRNGVPRGISGLDAYNRIFADATEWIKRKTIDYLVPQLYWALGGEQDYARLARWWASASEDRHLYTGHALYRAGTDFNATQIPKQVEFNRNHPDILGSVFFRATHLQPFRAFRFSQIIRRGLYKFPSLPPSMEWKDQTPPSVPFNLVAKKDGNSVVLTWDVFGDSPLRYTVYRVHSEAKPNADLAAEDTRNLIALTGETEFKDTPNTDEGKQWYFVRSVSDNSIESGASDMVASPVATSLEVIPDIENLSIEAYPTIFNEQVQVDYSLQTASPITLQIFDTIGRSVATLVEDEFKPPGRHSFVLSSREYVLPIGMYWVVLSTDQLRVTQAIVRTR